MIVCDTCPVLCYTLPRGYKTVATNSGKTHLGIKAIEAAEEGDIVVVDNGGRLDTSCWVESLQTELS